MKREEIIRAARAEVAKVRKNRPDADERDLKVKGLSHLARQIDLLVQRSVMTRLEAIAFTIAMLFGLGSWLAFANLIIWALR